MHERIIYAPGANGTELLRSLAKEGRPQLGTRIMGAPELARFSCMRRGIVPAKRLISFREQTGIIFSLLSELDLDYFSSFSYADAENIAKALNTLRSLITADESRRVADTLSSGIFKEKNDALLTIYRAYMNKCAELRLTDSVACIREAAESAEPLDAEIVILREFPLDPLQRLLLDSVSGGKYSQLGLAELFNVEAAPLRVSGYTAAYGASNEAEDIIGKIFENGYPLDQCVVAAADAITYSQLFCDLSQSSGIPMTFGSGVPILNTHPAKLLRLLAAWNGKGMHGGEALHDLIFSPSFNRSVLMESFDGLNNSPAVLNNALAIAGQLRLGTDAGINSARLTERESVETDEGVLRLLKIIRELFHDFEKGFIHIIRRYSVIRPQPDGQLDSAAVKTICDSLSAMNAYAGAELLSENTVIESILSKTVRSQNSAEGCLHICSINDALCTVRRHLFIAGLSADIFPGSPRENYLLLDSDFGEYAGAAPTSERAVLRKREQYDSLLRFAAATGTDVRVSYPSYSHSDLKEINASYDLLRSFREEHSEDMSKEDEESAGFFKHIFSPASAVGREYMNGSESDGAAAPPPAPAVTYDTETAYSPTAIEAWLKCPRQFFLRYVLGIKQPEDNDPYAVITPKDEGIIAHKLLESLRPDTAPDDFMAECARAFDDYLKKVPPVVPERAETVKDAFLEMMRNALEDDPGNTPVLCEEEISAKHPSGAAIHGYPDRLELSAGGKYIIVDYKTGRHLSHINNDPVSCFQALLYAWLLEEAKGLRIDHVEYRYPRRGETVVCDYDENAKNYLNSMLRSFYDGLVNGVYSPCAECDEYCRFAGICEKAVKEAERDARI